MRTIIILFGIITILMSVVIGGTVYYWQSTNINNLIDQNREDQDRLYQQIQDLQKTIADLQVSINNQSGTVTVSDEEQKFQAPGVTATDQIGYIKSIDNLDDKYYLNIDYIVTFNKTSADGIMARIEDGVCKSEEDCDMHPGTYIRNNNSLIRKFELLNTNNLNMVSYKKSDGNYTVQCSDTIPQARKVNMQDLINYSNYLNQTQNKATYFRIKLVDNKVVEINEMTFCLP